MWGYLCCLNIIWIGVEIFFLKWMKIMMKTMWWRLSWRNKRKPWWRKNRVLSILMKLLRKIMENMKKKAIMLGIRGKLMFLLSELWSNLWNPNSKPKYSPIISMLRIINWDLLLYRLSLVSVLWRCNFPLWGSISLSRCYTKCSTPFAPKANPAQHSPKPSPKIFPTNGHLVYLHLCRTTQW